MIFLFAGHSLSDGGATGVNGRKEADETRKLRDLIKSYIPTKIVVDDDRDNLSSVLTKAHTGSGSVVLDIHFNAVLNAQANGMEVIISDTATKNSRDFASELLAAGVSTTGIKSRRVKTEKESARGRLGVMREAGQVALIEVGFISNKSDMAKYDANVNKLAQAIAGILIKRDALL